jgi:hypothetical protein
VKHLVISRNQDEDAAQDNDQTSYHGDALSNCFSGEFALALVGFSPGKETRLCLLWRFQSSSSSAKGRLKSLEGFFLHDISIVFTISLFVN